MPSSPIYHFQQPYEFEPIRIPGTVFAMSLKWQNEILLRNGSTVPPNYMVTLKRIRRLEKGDNRLEFTPQFTNGKTSGAGLHVSIQTYSKLYQSLFCLPSPNRSSKHFLVSASTNKKKHSRPIFFF